MGSVSADTGHGVNGTGSHDGRHKINGTKQAKQPTHKIIGEESGVDKTKINQSGTNDCAYQDVNAMQVSFYMHDRLINYLMLCLPQIVLFVKTTEVWGGMSSMICFMTPRHSPPIRPLPLFNGRLGVKL